MLAHKDRDFCIICKKASYVCLTSEMTEVGRVSNIKSEKLAENEEYLFLLAYQQVRE